MATAPEQGEHDRRDHQHEAGGKIKAGGAFKPGHLAEIHAENTGDQGGRHENGSHHRQRPDFEVYPVTDRRQMNVQQSGCQFAQIIQGFDDVHGMVIDIAQIELDFRPEEVGVFAMQGAEEFAQRI